MSKYKSIDLFAGIGGIRLGFDRAFGKDIETVFVSEWDKYAQRTYRANFSDDFDIAGDITAIKEKDIPDFDICLAGFPCQAFSMAGKHQGFDDNYKGFCRGTLFLDVARICEYHKPKVIFCENVKGLVIHDKGRTLQIIKKTFSDIGYKVFTNNDTTLNSKNFGVPQNRERIYIVAFRNDIAPDTFEFPQGTDSTKTIRDILEEKPVPAKYYLSDVYLETLKKHRARHEALGHGFGYEIRDLDGIAGAIVCGGMGRERNLIIDKRQTDLTPTTHIKGKVNTEGIRKMTPREWARLQGFPDNYVLPLADVHLYKQFGNSVTVNVIEKIAKKIKEVLEMPVKKGKNKGEWSEIYIFFKLLSDGRVYVADKDMNKLKDVFLNIISIIREEKVGFEYRYFPGDNVKITLNGDEVKIVDTQQFVNFMRKVWTMITTSSSTFNDEEVQDFLKSIFIENITSPAQKKTEYFGGTEDIVLDTVDYRSGVSRVMGFSCKSDIDAASTLFNASGDNTNFVYELTGNMTDEIMDRFNSMCNEVHKKDSIKYEVATGDRMKYLREQEIDLNFVKTATSVSGQNLIRCCGMEMPLLVAGMLKYYYYECCASTKIASLDSAVRYLAMNDFVNYGFDNLYDTYRSKVTTLLYAMFTGLRFTKAWSGRSDVNGGYIVVKRDGDVVAFHSCIADEFKDFLFEKLNFEAPSCTRHKYMAIYKDEQSGKYYLKLALQFRFKLLSGKK